MKLFVKSMETGRAGSLHPSRMMWAQGASIQAGAWCNSEVVPAIYSLFSFSRQDADVQVCGYFRVLRLVFWGGFLRFSFTPTFWKLQ